MTNCTLKQNSATSTRACRYVVRLGVLALACIAVAAPTVGQAAPGKQTTQIHLRYDHRDLASPAAARKLLHRIHEAALEACGASSFSLSEVKRATAESSCWRDAVTVAVRRIDARLLTAGQVSNLAPK